MRYEEVAMVKREGRATPLMLRVVLAALVFLLSGQLPTRTGLTPDSMEFISIANSFVHGGGFKNPVMWHFQVPGPPPAAGHAQRAPVQPLLLAATFAVGGDVRAAYFVQSMLSSAVMAGFFLLACRWMHPLFAFAATFAISASLWWRVVTGYLLSEVPALAAYLLVLRTAEGVLRSHAGGLVCGFATILAWLARPNLAPLALAVAVAGAWELGGLRRVLRSSLTTYVASVALGMFAISNVLLWTTGSALYEAYGNAFENFPVQRAYRYGTTYTGTYAFVQEHWPAVHAAIVGHAEGLAAALFGKEYSYVGWLAVPGILVAIFAGRGRETAVAERANALAALGFSLVIILVYSAGETGRYALFPATACSLAGFSFVDRGWAYARTQERGAWTAGAVLAICGILVVVLLLPARRLVLGGEERASDAVVRAQGDGSGADGRAIREVCGSIARGGIVATFKPHRFHWICGNPTILLPHDFARDGILPRFIEDRQPAYLFVRKRSQLWLSVRGDLDLVWSGRRHALFAVLDAQQDPADVWAAPRAPRCLSSPSEPGCEDHSGHRL